MDPGDSRPGSSRLQGHSGVGTPHKVTISPLKGAPSPGSTLRSNHDGIPSPSPGTRKGAVSPMKGGASPGSTLRSGGGDAGASLSMLAGLKAKTPTRKRASQAQTPNNAADFQLVRFLTDIRQLDDHEVLQLPLTRTSERAMRALRASNQLRSDDGSLTPSLEDYLGAVGRYFGKNPNYWESAGDDKVEVFEEPGKRTIKRTTTFWGWKLQLFWELPFYDIRLSTPEAERKTSKQVKREVPVEADGGDGDDGAKGSRGYYMMKDKQAAGYDIKYREITTNDEWLQLIYDQPWSDQTRRRKTAEFLQAKVEHKNTDMQLEGVHGIWELAVNPDNHNDIVRIRILCLVDCLKGSDWTVVQTTCNAIWALSTSSSHRQTFGEAGVVEHLLRILKDLMKLEVVREGTAAPEEAEDGDTPKAKPKTISEETRDSLQETVIGTLAMLLVDKHCREPLIAAEPNFKTLLAMCTVLDSYKDEVTAARRVECARILTSLIQRDADVRRSLVKSGQLKTVLALMRDSGGPGFLKLCFCMAAALATLVLDEEVMAMVRQRGEAPLMFSACMQLLLQTLEVLEDGGTEEMSTPHGVKLAEAAGQAMWGSAYECVQPEGGGVTTGQIDTLAAMAFQTMSLAKYPVSRVLHCLAATLATLASNEDAAAVIMESHKDDSDGGPVHALLQLVTIKDKLELRGNGHSRAAATTGLAFLAGHSFKSQGDECMFGPHRMQLLACGTMDRLLEAALTKDADPELFSVIQHSAAVGVMYLSTMAGTVSAKALAMLAALMQNSVNIEMVEYLMAAFWILLRNGGNRKLLSEAFATNPMEEGGWAACAPSQDVSNTNEVSDSVQAAQNQLEQQFGSLHLDKEEKYAEEDGRKKEGELQPIEEGGGSPRPEGDPAPAGGREGQQAGGNAGAEEDGDGNPGLKRDWGLEILVSVGQTWIDSLLEADDMTEGDTPLLKLFEFLVASLCLFLIDEDAPVLPRRTDIFEMGVPPGGRKRQTWWSVAVTPPGVEPREPPSVENALLILCKLLTMRMYIGWKVVQLSVSSLWNCTVRSASVEKLVVRNGAVELLINIASTEYWPPTLREAAAGHLMSLAEEWANIEHVDGTKPLQAVMIKLIKTKHPLLEMRAARYLGRMTYCVPYLQPRPKAAMVATKESIAALDGITHLVKLLIRCQKRYTICLASERKGDDVNFRPTVGADKEEHPALYERDINNMVSVLENYYYTLCALLNLSTLKDNQTIIARKGLRVLLGIISYFSRQSEIFTRSDAIEKKLYLLASSIIQNLSLHPKNRTVFYKAELTGSAALERELEVEGGEELVLPRIKMTRSMPEMPASKLIDQRMHKSLLEPINTVRPKMAFPIISPGGSLMPSAGSTGEAGLGHTTSQHPHGGEAGEGADGADDNGGDGDSHAPLSQPAASYQLDAFGAHMEVEGEGRERFLRWVEEEEELALYGKPPDVSTLPGFARPKEYSAAPRRRVFDEEGNWITVPKSMKGLPQLLRRPMSHLWEETPDHNMRNGKQRWQPTISEFRQPKAPVPMGEVAGRLLTTHRPNAAADHLLRAAVDISKTGHLQLAAETQLTIDRPTTAMREGGRMALTRLLPDEELLRSSWDKGKEEVRWERSDAVSLNVVLAPSRDRTVISFEEKLVDSKDPLKPRLSVFEAVYQDLFPAYQLPNGKRAHFYFQGGSLVDEVEVLLPAPPARPSSIPSALQRQFPMTDVLSKISRPPGSAPPFIPYKPVPRLAPLPKKHTLRVKAPLLLTTKAFGNLRPDNLQFIVKFNRITSTETETSTEDVYVAPVEEREPWELPKSIFKPRVKEADSRDFWDNDIVTNKVFERDWQRSTAKEKFYGFLLRENKGNTNNDKPTDEQCIKQVHDVMKKYYKSFYSCFMYFASIGSGSPFHMQLNPWTMFLDSANIPDAESLYIKRSDCDTLFIVSNYVADKKAPENKVNDDHALMRFEFMEAVVRAAAAKYGKGIATVDLAEAVEMLFLKNILPALTPYSAIWPNDFRESRLYTEECDSLFKKHSVLLKAIYSRYRLRPSGGGLRPKVLKLDGWHKLMDDVNMCDGQFALQEATQCFMWSRMVVIDELKAGASAPACDFARYECLTFIDFLEALGRVAEMKFLPAASDLKTAGYDNVLEWAIAKESGEDGGEGSTLFKPRESCILHMPKTRPLYAKVDVLLDYIFRRLFYDPTQPEAQYSKDATLRLVRKIDKEMGS
eukprot:jgi/Tetstr1/454921/TSEL_041784.t1